MPEDSTEMRIEHGQITEARETRPLLPEELRPSRSELQKFVPKPELYNLAYPVGADLPHHGVLHGEETAILAAILLNAAHADVKSRLGEKDADTFSAKIDREALLYAAAYHDCGRITDWGLHRNEMQLHGPRGAEHLKDRTDEINPALSDEQVERMLNLISLHTPSKEESRTRIKDLILGKVNIHTEAGAARKADRKRHFEEYDDPEELMLRLLQEADKLGLARGYYSRTQESPHRLPYAAGASVARALKSHVPAVRNRPGVSEQGLRFDVSKRYGLWNVSDQLTRMDRRDPAINAMFANVPHRSGAAVEAATRLEILKR